MLKNYEVYQNLIMLNVFWGGAKRKEQSAWRKAQSA
jgi:hypothetical protein